MTDIVIKEFSGFGEVLTTTKEVLVGAVGSLREATMTLGLEKLPTEYLLIAGSMLGMCQIFWGPN